MSAKKHSCTRVLCRVLIIYEGVDGALGNVNGEEEAFVLMECGTNVSQSEKEKNSCEKRDFISISCLIPPISLAVGSDH